jgi:hypothetical protein
MVLAAPAPTSTSSPRAPARLAFPLTTCGTSSIVLAPDFAVAHGKVAASDPRLHAARRPVGQELVSRQSARIAKQAALLDVAFPGAVLTIVETPGGVNLESPGSSGSRSPGPAQPTYALYHGRRPPVVLRAWWATTSATSRSPTRRRRTSSPGPSSARSGPRAAPAPRWTARSRYRGSLLLRGRARPGRAPARRVRRQMGRGGSGARWAPTSRPIGTARRHAACCWRRSRPASTVDLLPLLPAEVPAAVLGAEQGVPAPTRRSAAIACGIWRNVWRQHRAARPATMRTSHVATTRCRSPHGRP